MMNDDRPNLLGPYGGWAAGAAGGGSGPPPELSFRHPRWASLEEWKAEARPRVRSLLQVPGEGERPPVAVRVRRRATFDGLEVEQLAWRLPYGPPAEAVFLKPAGSRGRLPGVLALHDHAGVKYFGKRKIARVSAHTHPLMLEHQRLYYGGAAWANELARRGYGVLVVDVFPFESRRIRAEDLPAQVIRTLMASAEEAESVKYGTPRGEEELQVYEVPADEPAERIRAYDALARRHEEVIAKSLLCSGRVFPGVVAAEDLWALDYLCARPDVEPDRIGCCGLSGGGLRADFLAGLDDRIRCAVAAGFMTTWRDFTLSSAYMHSWMLYVPYLPALMDFPEILGLRAPLPALVLANREDPLFDPGEVRRAAGLLQAIYRQAASADAFRFSLHPGSHQFNREMQEEAFAWLDRWLKG
jgi:dienelactone hydrolase